MLFRRPGKKLLSGDHITPSAQEKIDGPALFVYGAIQVHPLTADLDISLIYPPGVADRPRITAPALLKFRDVPLHPPQNGRMGQGNAAVGPCSRCMYGQSLPQDRDCNLCRILRYALKKILVLARSQKAPEIDALRSEFSALF